jgi:hypothetical protein
MRRVIAYPVMLLSGAGVLLCLASYVRWLTGSYHPFKSGPPILFVGIFVVWVPTVLLMNTLTRDFKQRDLWKAALRGCPSWMRMCLWIGTGSVVAITFLPVIFGRNRAPSEGGFTLFPIIFYAVSFCTMYSILHVDELDAARRCLNGHTIPPLAKFCEECGAPAAPDSMLKTDIPNC